MKGFLLFQYFATIDFTIFDRSNFIFIAERVRLSSIFYKIPSIWLSVHRRRSSVQTLRDGGDGCLVHFVNIANYMSLCAMEMNGSLEKNLLVNDEITVSRPANMPSTRLWSQTLQESYKLMRTNFEKLSIRPFAFALLFILSLMFRSVISIFH